MIDIRVNLHNHSTLSDGSGSFFEIAQAGLDAGIDCVILTDHNVYVSGQDQFYYRAGQRLLMICGEELNSRKASRNNHLIVLGVESELSSMADDPQTVIHYVNRQNGISILAHPFDPALPYLHQESYAWTAWDISGFSGIEIFNLMSQFKSRSATLTDLARNLISPKRFPLSPSPKAIEKWDELLCQSLHVNAYAGSDSHQLYRNMLGKTVIIFPYRFHFEALNNHCYIPEPLTGELSHDKQMILDALRVGRTYLCLDHIASAEGFEFFADGETGVAWPGESIPLRNSITFQIKIPRPALCRLIHNGKILKKWEALSCAQITVFETGYYRVECYLPFEHELRGWIFTNPIYIVRG